MDKSISTLLYYEDSFDVPLKGRDDAIIEASDAIHLSQLGFIPVEYSELIKAENILLENGAIRGKDYLISCHVVKGVLPYITLHTTHKFISDEDFETNRFGELNVADE